MEKTVWETLMENWVVVMGSFSGLVIFWKSLLKSLSTAKEYIAKFMGDKQEKLEQVKKDALIKYENKQMLLKIDGEITQL